MQLSSKYGFAFLCMPKCASTSIESALSRFCNIQYSGHPGLKHLNAKTFVDSILPVHRKLVPAAHMESICLMRDPLDWIESWYRYRHRDGLRNPNHPNHSRSTWNMSYDEFIAEYVAEGPRKPYANLGTQFRFLTLGDGQVGIDHIIPMNRIDLFEDFISEKLGERISIPSKNTSAKMNLSIEDPTLEFKLNKHFAQDIILYNFIKENEGFNKKLHSNEIFAALQFCS